MVLQLPKRFPDAHKILSLKNVIGVGKGLKIVGGKVQDVAALVVLVSRKLTERELSLSETVPRHIRKIQTDVIEVGEVRLLGRADPQRPAQPGQSIGHYKTTAGTFGAVVKDKLTGEPLILSNNHVLANSTDGRDGRAQIGDPVYQPGPYDGGTPEHTIAYLERFIPLRKEYARPECRVASATERTINYLIKKIRPRYTVTLKKATVTPNLVDAALARPLSSDLIKPDILGIGPVLGVREPELRMTVQKSGRSSGVNRSQIIVLEATLKVGLGSGESAWFADQFLTAPMAYPGDSGSLVLTEKNEAVGLLFAGSEKITVCNRITNVLNLLDITF